MIEPIRLSLEVACSVEHAFATWASRPTTWWPPTHKLSGDPQATVVFEPRVGGRLFERASDGREVEWGEVIEWSPPSRFRYLWYLATERENATDVAIDFVALAAQRCRVEIVHGGWDGLGDLGEPWRQRNSGGWSGVLPRYQEACQRG